MEIKLDGYDKKILQVLVSNARESVTAIGKKVRLRRENVGYRIKRMIKLGLIKGFNAVINEKKLGLEHYVVFLQLINLGEKTEEEILSYLRKSECMTWVGTAAGKWSLIFDVIVKNESEADNALRGLFGKFSKFIGKSILLKLHDGDFFDYKFIGFSGGKHKDTNERDEMLELDEKDMKILEMLNEDARASYVEISEKVNLTPNGVHNRVKTLEKIGIIERYAISIDWKKLGYEWYGLQFDLAKFEQETGNKLKSFLKNHKKITFYYRYFGGAWGYDIGIIVRNSIELRQFINELRKEFAEDIVVNDVFLVLDEAVSYNLPNGVFS